MDKEKIKSEDWKKEELKTEEIFNLEDSKKEEMTKEETFKLEDCKKEELKKKRPFKLEDFKLLKTIGLGMNGTVFAAEYEDKLCAIKAVKKDKSRFSMFGNTEKNVLMKIKHPFIVKFFGCFTTNTRLCYVLQYAPAGNLIDFLKNNGYFLPLGSAQFYGAELCSAISYLHSKGIIHRDLKFDNILIDKNGHLLLTDFGSALEEMLEGKSSSLSGTLWFLAPEVLKSELYSYEVDWWSFGVCLYFMICRTFPFNFGYKKHSLKTAQIVLESDIKFPDCIPDDAITMLKRLLQKDPNKRLGKRGAVEVRSHPFFATIDWYKLENKEVEPPFIPQLESKTDFRYFEQNKLPLNLTKNVEKETENPRYKDFDYVNPDPEWDD